MNERVIPEPTCFVKALQEFRTDSIPGRRMSAFGFPGLGIGDAERKNVGKPTKLVFDESCLNETEVNFSNKKRRIQDDTPESHRSNDSFSITSPWESRKMQADLAAARSEIARLESTICQMETVHKETLVLFEHEKKCLQQSLEKERSNASEYDFRIRTLRKQKSEIKQELLECQSSLRKEKLNLEEKYHNLLQENMVLKDKFSELDCTSADKIVQLERKLALTEQQVTDMKEELNSNKEMLNDLREELNAKCAESHAWEIDKAKLNTMSQKLQELEYEKESHQKAIAMAQAQQSKLLRLFDLEKEVAALKEEKKNLRQAITDKLYLEGVVADLRSRLSVLQEREKEIVSLKVELGVTQTRLKEWTEMSKQILGQPTSSPISLRQSIENLQMKEVSYANENAQLKSLIRKLELSERSLSTEIDRLKFEIENLKRTNEQNSSTIKGLKRQNSLIIWERNDLRQLLDSCQKDFNMTTSGGIDMQYTNRIEALEKALDGFKRRNEQLEKELNSNNERTGGNSGTDMVDFNKLKNERDCLLAEKEALNKKIEELQDQLEYRALKGDFDVRQTKIIHFRDNPLSGATSSHDNDLEKCRLEIAQLKERVKLLQEGKAHDLTQIINERIDTSVVKEVEELKEKLSSQERQNIRLREVFKMTSQEFREAVYVLLGYKVDALDSKNYRLTSMYAESPDQNLMFKMNQSGGMDLLGTPFYETLDDLIDMHLRRDNSLPVFLSALTMQLFQRQTMCITNNPQGDTEIVLSD